MAQKVLRVAVGILIMFAMALCLGAPTAAQTSAPNRRTQSGAESAPSGTGPVLTLTPGIASTVAGTGVSGYGGDGGPATAAQFNFPTGMARDVQGNLYVADTANSVVRKFSVGGAISTVAGNGTQGYSGDGGSAVDAQLAFPTAVAVDGDGNLYIADFFNACVRKVDTNGVISTFATASGFLIRGVAVDAAGNVYFSSWYEGVWKADPVGTATKIAGNGTPGFSGDGGLATNAQTAGVAGLAVDSQGNVYLAEVLNSDIRKITLNGIITTVAGNQQFGYSGDGGPAASAKLNGPTDVAVDAAGNLYISDSSNNSIRKVDGAGTITTIAGDSNYGYSGDGGLASAMRFAGLTATVLDSSGNLFVGDSGNNAVRRVRVDTTALDFGTVTVGQAGGPLRVVVGNSGAGDLNFSSIVASAGFSVQSSCSTTTPLQPATECSVDISFVPTVDGAITGWVTLDDDADGHPHLIALQGQGNVISHPDFAVSTSVSSVTIGKASSGIITATVTPSQGFAGAIALSCIGLPSHATCSFSPATLQANGSNTALNSSVTIFTGVANVAAVQRGDLSLSLAAITGAFSLGLLGLVFSPRTAGNRSLQDRSGRKVQLILLALILCGLAGCGSLGGKSSTTPPGSYTVTVWATSGAVSHSSAFTLVVQ